MKNDIYSYSEFSHGHVWLADGILKNNLESSSTLDA